MVLINKTILALDNSVKYFQIGSLWKTGVKVAHTIYAPYVYQE